MPSDKRYKRAIVRGVPDTFDRCVKPHGENDPENERLVDVDKVPEAVN